MKKLLFLTYILLLTSPTHSMKPIKTLFSEAHKITQMLKFARMQADDSQNMHEHIKNAHPAVKNLVLQNIVLKNYKPYRSDVEILVKAGADPNSIPHNGLLPLAIALDQNDIDFVTLLLTHFANPNLIVNPTLTDIDSHQEIGSCPNIHQFIGKPPFYFSKKREIAQLCLDYGAQANLNYCNYPYKSDYGNILSYVIDNDDYSTDLIDLYLEHGAGPYSTSHASYDGSTLHHLVHALNIRLHDTDANRLLIIADKLLTNAPSLLESKDQDGNTPGDCLNLAMQRKNCNKDTLKKFAQLFNQYPTAANIKNKLRE